jgi:hypothetical protein
MLSRSDGKTQPGVSVSEPLDCAHPQHTRLNGALEMLFMHATFQYNVIIFASMPLFCRHGFGSQHFLHKEPCPPLAVAGSATRSSRIPGCDFTESPMSACAGRRNRGSRSSSFGIWEKYLHRRVNKNAQGQFGANASRSGSSEFWLANRLWRFLRQRILEGTSCCVYWEPGDASSNDVVPGGIARDSDETWCGVR